LRLMLCDQRIEQGMLLTFVLPRQDGVVRQHTMLKRIKACDLVAFSLSFQTCWPGGHGDIPLLCCDSPTFSPCAFQSRAKARIKASVSLRLAPLESPPGLPLCPFCHGIAAEYPDC
jgi:hypothetical protein